MTCILDALLNYAEIEEKNLSNIYSSTNRINRAGDRLEYFTKDLFCNSFNIKSKEGKEKEYSKHLSWKGSKNHPPDFIIKGGDAFEVKKRKSKAGHISLNSSYPHQKLYKENKRITEDCRNCENDIGGWEEKDLVYVIGRVPKASKLDFLWMIYGDCWAAPRETYKELSDNLSLKINQAVKESEYGELNEKTNEIGKVKKVDQSGRTELRIRGMWRLEHPANYFKKHVKNYEDKISGKQPLFTVMQEKKFAELPDNKKDRVKQNQKIKMEHIDIPDPSKEDEWINALIFEVEG